MRPGQAAHVHAAQAVVVNQVAEHGLDGALADPAFALAPPALLPHPGPAVGRVVNGAVNLLTFGAGDAGGLALALLAVAARGPVDFVPASVLVRVVLLEGHLLAFGAGKGIGGPVVGEALNFGLVLPKDGNLGRDAGGFEPGVVRAVGVARVRE